MEASDEFDQAADYLRGIAGKLDNQTLLYLYARFKQAKEGPCNIPKPGFFDFQGKTKWNAWNELGDMSQDVAMEEYVACLDKIDADWRGKEPEGDRGWVSVSTLGRDTDPFVDPGDKSILDWIKESHLEKVKAFLATIDKSDLNSKDEGGMGLIHWAADRGDAAIVQLLLDAGVDVNLTDGEGQTALHFAASCGHADVVQLLLSAGIDKEIRDGEGLRAADGASDDKIKLLMN